MKKLFYCLESKKTKTNWLANLKELYSETFYGKKISVNTQRGSRHKNEFIRSNFGIDDDIFLENVYKLLSKIIEKAGLNNKNKELQDTEIKKYFNISAVTYGTYSSEYGSVTISLKDKYEYLKEFFKKTYNTDFDKYEEVIITNTGTKLIIRKSLSPATLGITSTYTRKELLSNVKKVLDKQNSNLSDFLYNILSQIDENPNNNKLPVVSDINALANSDTHLFPITITNTNIKLPQVWVDFGEIIGAVYLLKVLELNGAQSVEFPKASNNPGIDYSIHFNDGNIANISAKAGKGAAASSKDIFEKLKTIISTKKELSVFDKIVNILGDVTIDMPKKLLNILQIINTDAYNYINTESGITLKDSKDNFIQKLRVKDNNFFKVVCEKLGVTTCASRVLKYDIKTIDDINLLSLLFYPIKVAIAKYINHLDENSNFMPILKNDAPNALTNAVNSVINGYQLSMYHHANKNGIIDLKFVLYSRNKAKKYRIKPGGYLGDYTLNHFGIELSK